MTRRRGRPEEQGEENPMEKSEKMLKTEKPILKEWNYIGIHTIKPLEETEWNNSQFGHSIGFNTKIGEIEPLGENGKETFYQLTASHEVTLTSDNWNWSMREAEQRDEFLFHKSATITKSRIDGIDFANPNQLIGMIIWARRKYLGRNPGAAFIYINNHLYHTYSWKDVVGKNSKMSRMCKIRNRRLVIFAQQRTEKESEVFIELFNKEKPKSAR